MRPRLLFLLKYYLFWIFFFVVGKGMFLAWYTEQSAALPFSTLLGVFLHGLRMDAAAAAFFAAVPFLLVALSVLFPWRYLRRVVLWWTIALVIFAAGLTVGDLKLYEEWGFRIDSTWVRYLETPAGIAATIADSPLLILFTLIVLFATAGIMVFRRWVYTPHREMPAGGIGGAAIALVATALLPIPARGGLQLTSLTYSTVYFSNSDFANASAINVAWSFFNSLYRGGLDRTNPYLAMSEREATLIRDSLIGRSEGGPSVSLLRIPRPNVILIIWEGVTAKVVAPLGGTGGVTPRFDSLVATGVFFDRFYASGNRTDKGVAAILAGYPALPKTAVLKEPRRYQGLPGLGGSFRDAGYVTSFLKGGELEFANIRAFVLQNGFDRLVERKYFPRETWNSMWGAHDHILLDRVLNDADTTTTPWFLTALTLSSHEPYDIPGEYFFGDSTKQARYLSSLRYTDSALGRFIAEASRRPWWDSTLIIVLPDHGNRLPPIDPATDAFRETSHHVPMLWLGGALRQTGVVRHELGNHTDFAPTLLAQLGIADPGFVWGQDLFRPGRIPFAYYTFNDGFGYLTERGGVIWGNVGGRVLRSFGTTDSLDLRAGQALQQVFVGDFVAR